MRKIWQKLVTSWSFSKLHLNGSNWDVRIGNASLSLDFYGDVYGSALASFIGGVYCGFSSETVGRGASFMFVVSLNVWAWVSEGGREFGRHGFEIWYFAIKVLAKTMFVSYGFGVFQIAPPTTKSFWCLSNRLAPWKKSFRRRCIRTGFFKYFTLLTTKTFRETATVLSEYRDDRKAKVFVHFYGGSKADFYCILGDRWKNLKDRFDLSKRLKEHCTWVAYLQQFHGETWRKKR